MEAGQQFPESGNSAGFGPVWVTNDDGTAKAGQFANRGLQPRDQDMKRLVVLLVEEEHHGSRHWQRGGPTPQENPLVKG